ncbi:branched-chain amino acid ABC transporter permease [Ottowia testudinis]|uniref:Branched-chain amino acid ABC transporter permease n=1 Tax=Ottowia testudinis TaxID=2816950 RepID=A0A975H564_9BURK|nr:branched-chain amino acid ABC transporter permease [Ottowia testudinis]QTD47115.1 branched-chain amino acid ABC transporter permease [Ottowia testudinis]
MPAIQNPSSLRARWIIWGAFALALLVAPWVFSNNLSITILCQIGIAIIACLSYNMLLGQGGMLSFGHAVYTGLGSFIAMHALNAATGGKPSVLLVVMLPLIGGLAGLFFAVLLGYVTTRRSGTTFAMITLGVAELVFAMSLMIPEFFGGEGGISGNRMTEPFMGITFGPQRQVYYLIAVYTFISVAAMYAFTRTPLGRMLNAVRDNPERVEFVGYNAQRVRYLAFIVAGFFAGISGGLAALNFEIVTAEVVGAARSGSYLLFTFLGGATFFFGPIIGAVLMVLAFVLFSELTKAWLLYLGLIFMLMVMYAPGGIASLIMMNVRVAAFGRLRELLGHYLLMAVTGVVALLGLSALIEMIYHRQLEGAGAPALRFLGMTLDGGNALHWLAAAAVAAVGMASFEWARRRFARRWHVVQEYIEHEIKKREVAA